MERIVIDCSHKGCRHKPNWILWGPTGGKPERSCSTHISRIALGLLKGAHSEASVKLRLI